MQLNKDNTGNDQHLTDKKESFIYSETIENIHYLYPNGHRSTHQMRWFKGSRDRGFRSDLVA